MPDICAVCAGPLDPPLAIYTAEGTYATTDFCSVVCMEQAMTLWD